MIYEINGLLFDRTCYACPEQYDVYQSGYDEPCAYVRLRWGRLSATVPDCMGKEIYAHEWEDDGFKGCFDTEEECLMHLTKIAEAISGNFTLEKARKALQAVQAQYNHEAIIEAASQLPDVAVEIGKGKNGIY